jgi:hypothetical protein
MTVARLVRSLALGVGIATTACVPTTTSPPIQELGMRRVTPAAATSGADVDATATVSCGDTMCAPTDLCVAIAIAAVTHGNDGQSQSPPTLHYECSATPVESSSAITCAPASGGRQSCHGNVTSPTP